MKNFIIISHEQGSEAWHEWRHNGIGASDASTIMGENRFASIDQLLREKCHSLQIRKPNEAMARGTELEPQARRDYIRKTGKEVRPACIQSTRYEWLRASLDGLSIDADSVVEIKCGESAYNKSARSGYVPDYYYGQIQHILAVTGFDHLDYWCYWPGRDPILITVPRNPLYIDRLLKSENEFWNLIITKKRNI